MKVVVVEDETMTLEKIAVILEKRGYEPVKFRDGINALEHVAKNDVDIMILDIKMPGIEGFEVARRIRNKPEVYGTPMILMLTSLNEDEEVIKGFESGADDYLRKPFNSTELGLRVESLARRGTGKISKIIKHGGLVIDTENVVIKENGETVDVSRREFDFIVYFVRNRGITLTRDKIMEEVFDMPYYIGNRTVDVYVKNLKKKLATFREALESVRGFGYVLKN
jgi:DNA-binding response OmpR family regulator